MFQTQKETLATLKKKKKSTTKTSNPRESQSDRQKCLTRSAAGSQWFNDLSTAGEWSHSNILFWLVLWTPPEGPAWHDSGVLWCQLAHHIDKIRVSAPRA